VESVPSVAFSSKPGRCLKEMCQHGWSCSAMGTGVLGPIQQHCVSLQAREQEHVGDMSHRAAHT